jgi:AcrR family transcriptional regulator
MSHQVAKSTESRGTATGNDGESRRRILKAAIELMAKRGYAGTSISMITTQSGLPPSSTYWHFGSKERLLAAVLEESARDWLASLPRWHQLHGEPRERLRKLLKEVSKTVADQPFLRLLLLSVLEKDQLEEGSMETIRRVRHQAAGGLRLAFREIFSTADDPRTIEFAEGLAKFALAAGDGIFIAHQLDPESTDVGAMFAMLNTALIALGEEFINSMEPSATT